MIKKTILFLLSAFVCSCPNPDLFKPPITLTLITNNNLGTVNPVTTIEVVLNDVKNISADPKNGAQFLGWTIIEGKGVEIANVTERNTTVILKETATVIRANFDYIPYNLTIKNSDGKGVPNPTGTFVAYLGYETRLSAKPYIGSCFKEWTVSPANAVVFGDKLIADTTATLSVMQNAVIEAVFMNSVRIIDTMGGTEVGGALSIASDGNEIYVCRHNCATGIEDFRFIPSRDRGGIWTGPITWDGDKDTSYSQMTVLPNGAVCMCYSQQNGTSSYDLKFKVSFDKGQNWETPAIIQSNYSGSISMCAIGNVLYCCYYDTNAKSLKFSRSSEIAGSGITWIAPIVIDSFGGGDIGSVNAMAVSGNTIHVCYNDATHTNLRYARSSDLGSSWECRTIVDPMYDAVGGANSIASDGSNVFVVYYDYTNKCLKFVSSADGGKTWPVENIKTIDNQVTGVGASTVKSVNGRIYLAYTASSSAGNKIWFNAFPYNNPNSSNIVAIDPSTNIDPGSCAMVKSGNDIFVTYRDTSNNLKFARSSTDGARW